MEENSYKAPETEGGGRPLRNRRGSRLIDLVALFVIALFLVYLILNVLTYTFGGRTIP